MTDDSGFDLALRVTDPELVEWLEGLPEEEAPRRAEEAMRAGHFVLNLVQAAAGEEQMARYFRPVTDRMDELTTLLSELMTRAQKSQRLGELGETLVANRLEASFPGDRFRVVSEHGHEADIEASFRLGPEEEVPARIEVKLYTDDVKSKELEKFRSDLRTTGVRYGLMVSLASRIQTVQGGLVVEETDDFTALLVPSAGLDGSQLVAAVAMLKALMLYHARAERGARLRAAALEQLWARLQDEIGTIEAAVGQVAEFRESVRQAQRDVTRQLDALADAATSAQVRLAGAVQRLTDRLHDRLSELPTVDAAPRLPAPAAADRVVAFLDRLADEADKRVDAFRGLWELVERHGLAVRIEEPDEAPAQWVLQRREAVVAHTAGTGTRLDVVFPVEEGATVEVRDGLEKHKTGEVTVNGKDVRAMLDRVGERLEDLGGDTTS